jgi:hypothetical protein
MRFFQNVKVNQSRTKNGTFAKFLFYFQFQKDSELEPDPDTDVEFSEHRIQIWTKQFRCFTPLPLILNKITWKYSNTIYLVQLLIISLQMC